jgi:hypothetical protein
VDPESRRDFWASLFELADAGTTLLVSTHYMDEAERCHRLAILERGRLVADGTPQDLIASLPGRVWLLRSADTRAAEAALRGKPGIIGSAQIGNSLRVLAEPGTTKPALRALLPDAAQASVEAPNPTSRTCSSPPRTRRGARADRTRDEPEPAAGDRHQGTAAAWPRPLTFGMILGIPRCSCCCSASPSTWISATSTPPSSTRRARRIRARSSPPLEATGCWRRRTAVRTPEQLQELIRKGRINIGIVIPADLEQRLATRERPAVQVMVDGSEQTVQAARGR